MTRPNSMKLNNAVEEALGQGDSHRHHASPSSLALSASIESGAAAREEGDGVLKINHAEEERYGMSHH
jgi:hypothetical protein